MEIPKKIYILFFGGIAVGVIISLITIALVFPSLRQESKNGQPKTSARLPVFGEKGYDPKISGYPALIGDIRSVGADEIIFYSSWCLKKVCDPQKKYEYHAKIARDTILKRLTKKSEAVLAAETANRKDKNTPPDPFNEQPLKLEEVKAGENISVLIKEIINDSSVIAKEVSIFEPVPSLQTP